LLNLLALPDPGVTVARMRELGVLQVILPETGKHEVGKLAELVAAERAAGIERAPIRRLAALLPAVPPVAESVAARLRLSRSQRERLRCAAARDARDGENVRALAYREGIDCAVDRLLLHGSDTSALKDWSVPELPLKGGEIVARGVDAGPEVARILRKVESQWIDEGFPARDRVSRILDGILRAM
jgi:poly(A) polymerase